VFFSAGLQPADEDRKIHPFHPEKDNHPACINLKTPCAVSVGTRSGIAPADVENTEQISDPIFVNDTILVNSLKLRQSPV